MELRVRASQNQEEELDRDQKSLIEFLDSTIQTKKKKYKSISDSTREKLIQMTRKTGASIKKVAKKLRINYSTAKSICQIYDREGRFDKKPSKPFRRNAKKLDANKSDVEEEKGGKYSPEDFKSGEKARFCSLQCKQEASEARREKDDSTEELKNPIGHETSHFSKINANLDSTPVDSGQIRLDGSNLLLNTLMNLPNVPSIYNPAYQNNFLPLSVEGQAQLPHLLGVRPSSTITPQQLFLNDQLKLLSQINSLSGMNHSWNSVMSRHLIGNSLALQSQMYLQNIARMDRLTELTQKPLTDSNK